MTRGRHRAGRNEPAAEPPADRSSLADPPSATGPPDTPTSEGPAPAGAADGRAGAPPDGDGDGGAAPPSPGATDDGRPDDEPGGREGGAPPGGDGSALSAPGLASATRWMVLGRLVTQVSRLVVSVLLARLLAPEAFGLVAVAMTTILALEVLKDLGTGAAVIQRLDVDQRLLSSVFYLNAFTGVLTAGLMAAGAPIIAGLFSTPQATPVVRALSLVLLAGGFTQIHHAMLRRTMQFNGVALVEMTGALVVGVVSVGLALAGAGVWAMVWGNVAGATAGSVVAWRRSGWQPSLMFGWGSLRSIAGFSLHTAAFNATTFALRNTDKLLVGRWLGASPLGVYSLAQRTISYPVESIAHVLMTVLFPAFARVQEDHAALRKGYTRALAAIAFVTLPVTVGLAAVADPLVRALLGDQWLDLIPLLWFMAPAGGLVAMLSAVNTLYSAKGRADWMFRWGLVSGAATLGAFAIGLQWGLVGLAIAYLAISLILTPIGLSIPLRLIDMRLRELLGPLVPYVGMTLAMALAAWGTATLVAGAGLGPLPQMLAGIGAGGVVYLGLTLILRPMAYRDVRTVIRNRSPKAGRS